MNVCARCGVQIPEGSGLHRIVQSASVVSLPDTLVPVTRAELKEWVCTPCIDKESEWEAWFTIGAMLFFLFALVLLPVLAVWLLVRNFDPLLDLLSVIVLYWTVKCLIASIIGLYREWRRRLLWRATRRLPAARL